MRNIFFILFAFFIVSACEKNNDTAPDSETASEKDLIEFKFSASLNNILVDSYGTIGSSEVTVFLPANSDISRLTPEFVVSEDAMVKFNGLGISSGQQEIDFSDYVELTVVAEDNSAKSYTIQTHTNFISLDESIESLRMEFNIPGLQLAITRNEKLVYSNAYGMANTSTLSAVSNSSLFRIASISKPITAIAVLKLVEDGLISTDDFVFGPDAVLSNNYGSQPYATNIEQITIKHLLDHKSGWTNDPYDPMFANPDYDHHDLIGDMLDNRPLTYEPGSTYYYSNFGYCVLGRVIEEVTGASYENYVKANILAPMGISNMQIGGNSLSEMLANEVVYYDQENFGPYGMEVTRMDSHGGWVASATDLVKFLTYIDRKNNVSDIVNSSLLNSLYFGYQSWNHTGSLPGTSAILSRLNDQFGFEVLANSRTLPVDEIIDEMRQVLEEEINSRNEWPGYDLFN